MKLRKTQINVCHISSFSASKRLTFLQTSVPDGRVGTAWKPS